jgi:hypothetical protein
MTTNLTVNFIFSPVQIHDLYFSPNIVWVMRWAGHVARMMDKTNNYWDLIRKPEGKRPLGRPTCKWENNINWIFKKYDGSVDWTDVARVGTGGVLL